MNAYPEERGKFEDEKTEEILSLGVEREEKKNAIEDVNAVLKKTTKKTKKRGGRLLSVDVDSLTQLKRL